MTQDTKCPKGIENSERIMTLEREMGEVRSDIKEIKDKLLRRPSWIVTIIISFLSTLAFSALTFALTVEKMLMIKHL
jgi:hypothetical protein